MVTRSALRLVQTIALAMCAVSFAAQAEAGAPTTCTEPPPAALTVNVRDKGAKGDGKTDDTAAIQAAIDAVGGSKGTVFVPDGVYLIKADWYRPIRLKSRMTLKLAPNAVLKAIPNALPAYIILSIKDVSDVWVVGGMLQGDRMQHDGKAGEYGMGISIDGAAKRITIARVTSRDMWGDGFYVQSGEDIRLCAVTADNNRRQGLSIVSGNGILVLNSTFKSTHGTRPSAGIDLEPDKPSDRIEHIRIEGSKFLNNAGAGILAAGKKGPIAAVAMARNVFEGNARPIVVENAPAIAAAICGNRQLSTASSPSSGFNSYAEPVQAVVLQDDCGDNSFIMNRQKKKKKAD